MGGIKNWFEGLPTWGKVSVGVGVLVIIYLLYKWYSSSSAGSLTSTASTSPTSTMTSTTPTISTTPTDTTSPLPYGSSTASVDPYSQLPGSVVAPIWGTMPTSTTPTTTTSATPTTTTSTTPTTTTPTPTPNHINLIPSVSSSILPTPIAKVQQIYNNSNLGATSTKNVGGTTVLQLVPTNKTTRSMAVQTAVNNNDYVNSSPAKSYISVSPSYNASVNNEGGQYINHQFVAGNYSSTGQFVANTPAGATIYNSYEQSKGSTATATVIPSVTTLGAYNQSVNNKGGQYINNKFVAGDYNSSGQFVANTQAGATIYNNYEASRGASARAIVK